LLTGADARGGPGAGAGAGDQAEAGGGRPAKRAGQRLITCVMSSAIPLKGDITLALSDVGPAPAPINYTEREGKTPALLIQDLRTAKPEQLLTATSWAF